MIIKVWLIYIVITYVVLNFSDTFKNLCIAKKEGLKCSDLKFELVWVIIIKNFKEAFENLKSNK